MQSTTITLSVDLLNNGTPSDAVFVRMEDDVPNRSTYRGPEHSLTSTDSLNLYRTFPKRSGEYLGAAKVSVKFTKTVIVKSASGADVAYPLIGEFSMSIPVGTTDASALAMRQRVISILDRDDVQVELMKHLDV